MNIKCPNCQTAYVVPDERVGEKPKKMRCSRCQEIFTVKRRSQKTPLGYQEFTGRQNALPQEFAFLRASNIPADPATASVAQEAPSAPAQSAFAPQQTAAPTKTGSAPPPVPNAKPFPSAGTSGYDDNSVGFDNEQTSPGIAPAAVTPQAMKPITDAVPSQPQAMTAQLPPTAQIYQQPQQGAGAPANRPPSGAVPALSGDLYGGRSWETEAPLDLDSYAVPSAQSQRIGKYVAGGVGIVVIFLFFVLARNGFNLSFAELPEQIGFAFSGDKYEDLPDAVHDLEVVVNERRLLNRSSADTLLVVTGTVFNNSPVQRKTVVLRGKLIDTNGDIKDEVRIPCDKVFEDSALKGTRTGQILTLYRKGGELENCTIRGESSTVFQMVFESVPADYDSSFTLDIQPVNAE